ncbi:MAG: HD domain-containing phosphohydrolase [Planctomycetota bacterium]
MPTRSNLIDDTVETLVAEDEASARDLMASIFEVSQMPLPTFSKDGVEALDHIKRKHWDILITDLYMPRMSGETLIKNALAINPELTIIVITGNGTIDRAVDLMKEGVFDFLSKPYSVDRFLACVRRARERVLNLAEVRGIREVVDALMAALESKDRYLNGHSGRVSHYAVELGRLQELPRIELKTLEYAAMLHDVGKIGIHEDILNKPGRLTDEEYEIIKLHPVLSRDILAPVTFLRPCLPAVYHHHERIDGNGYPDGIAGDAIPLGARIIAVVDSFDAMSSMRSYRPALPLEKVLGIIQECAGTQLDAELSDLFLRNFERVTGLERPVEEKVGA